MAAGASTASSSARAWLATIVANGRFANGAPGPGALAVGEPADILVLDLDRLDRDAVMPVAPIDLVFARATMAHVARLIVAGREIVRDGRVVSVDLDAAHAALRDDYRREDALARAVPRRLGLARDWRSARSIARAFGCC